MACIGDTSCACGCCAGTSVQTPVAASNLPGLASIAYRTGDWSTFRESMLARLSSSSYPALAPLKTRDSSDFTIALLDSTAAMLDILTFYQERLANESYLRTANQLRSLTELSRLIGYRPSPGVSASVYLAFTLRTTPGLTPNPATPAIIIPAGTQAQSIPTQGQKPQIFETSNPIQAKADWNALPVQTGSAWAPATGDMGLYLAGIATRLQPGDAILVVGDERSQKTDSGQWDILFLTAVTPDAANQRTWVSWSKGLAGQSGTPATQNPKLYALRQRCALFGYNAANPNLFNSGGTDLGGLLTGSKDTGWTWSGAALSTTIDLDSLYSGIVAGSWLVMISPGAAPPTPPANGYLSLYSAKSVVPAARADFGLSAKITRIEPDYATDFARFPLNSTVVLAQSEELQPAEQPLPVPLYGTVLDLQQLRPDLVGIQAIALSGKRQKITVNSGLTVPLSFTPLDGSGPTTLSPGDVLTILDADVLPLNGDGTIPPWPSASDMRTLYVEDSIGRPGTVSASLSSFTLALAAPADPDVQECAVVSSVSYVSPSPGSASPLNQSTHTRILLQSRLLNCYDRNFTTVNANVGLATHGESVSEILGNGSASTLNQSFALAQSPLTYVQSPTPTGRQSTIEVGASSVHWSEVPSLFEQAASQRVFAVQNLPDGSATVLFGDGREGATLPTGTGNVIANYRTGSGAAGNVASGGIALVLDRAIGVTGVNNPQRATGGHDAETVGDIRASGPQTVLSLGRAVSLIDYRNFAAIFGGIAKASAVWIPAGPARGVFLTVAGVDGAALPPGNPSLVNLVAALREFGSPLVAIQAVTFVETLFGLSAKVKYDPGYDRPTVAANVMRALADCYSFARRDFGQGVAVDEVVSVIQSVVGVVAVTLSALNVIASSTAGDLVGDGNGFSLSRYSNWLAQKVTVPRPTSGSPSTISAYVPIVTAQGLPVPAEILVLSPDPAHVVLRVMP